MLFYVIISVFVSDIMNFNSIKSPKELYEFMEDNIDYGININNKIYTWDLDGEFQNICRDEWRLKSSEDIINSHYGICFDQVEIERDWFLNNNYEFKTIFIWFLFDYSNTYPTHTYLVYKENDNYYYFEHSDGNNKGIYEFDSYEDAIRYQLDKHIEMTKNYNKVGEEEIKHIHIYEFDKPMINSSFEDYLNHILNSKDITDKIIK